MKERGSGHLLILNHDRGFALLTVLIFGLIILLSSVAFFQLLDLDVSQLHTDKRYWQALYAAEAGVEKLKWLIKHMREIESNCSPSCHINPFHEDHYPYPCDPYDPYRWKLTDILYLVNPNEGDVFFPSGETNAPYFRIVDVWGEGSRVYFRVMGSVDTDGDGMAGLLHEYGGGYDFKNRDEDDVNRFFEAYVGLPGSMGLDISAGAKRFLHGNQRALLSQETGQFITYRGETISGFRYHEKEPYSSYWNRYRYVFSRPILSEEDHGRTDIHGKVILPKGLFSPQGDINPGYFSDIPMKTYIGNQTFGPFSDPTGDIPDTSRAVLFVYGDVQIDSVHFGYITGQGQLRGNDWRHTDVTVISTGNITVSDLDCGMVGRLTLIAKNIIFKGRWGMVINAIAIASGNIYLNSSQSSDFLKWVYCYYLPFPTYWSAYFYGTMLAGDTIYLNEGGWSIIYDRNVINGAMYRKDTFLDNFEDGSFNQSGNWSDTWTGTPDSVFFFRQGRYLQSELVSHQGDYSQTGSDGIPQLMRISSEPDLSSFRDHKTGIGKRIRYDLTRTSPGNLPVDWRGYSSIRFYMALDNWKRESMGRKTEKTSHWTMALKDRKVDGSTKEIKFSLTRPLETPVDPNWQQKRYLEDLWGNVSYQYTDFLNGDIVEPPPNTSYSSWKLINLDFADFKEDPSDPGKVPDFDFSRIEEFSIYMVDFKLSWPVLYGGIVTYESIVYIPGAFIYIDREGNTHSIQSNASGEILYLNPATGAFDLPVLWNPDPSLITPPKNLKVHDLRVTLRMDRLVIPGSNYRNYGLPSCFRYEVSRWRELSEEEAMK